MIKRATNIGSRLEERAIESQQTGVNTWEDRERELMTKFGNVIHHLQMEIAKQNVLYNTHQLHSQVCF